MKSASELPVYLHQVDLLQKAVKQAQRQLRFREDVLDPAKDMFKDCVWKVGTFVKAYCCFIVGT
jgi:hypothetical protein